MKPIIEMTDEELAAHMKEHNSYIAWDLLKERGKTPDVDRPAGPFRKASSYCRSGKHDWCTCDACF